jgi:general secretion pathway protein A
MILVGQPELKFKLQRMDLKQFAQRVSVYCHLDGLNRDEVGNYIRYRLGIGQAQNVDLFEEDAIDLIYSHSNGIPRIINIICDTALVYGYADGLQLITRSVIEEVINEREQSGIFKEFEKDGLLLPVEKGKKPVGAEASGPELQKFEARITRLEEALGRLTEEMNDLKNLKDERDHIIFDLFKMLENSLKKRMQLLALVGKLSGSKEDRGSGGIEEQLQKLSLVKE